MAQWLETILAEINGVSEAQENSAEPEEEGCQHEHAVGIADSNLRKTFFLFKQYTRRSRELAAALSVCGKSEREQLVTEYRRFDQQADALKEIFWVSCRAAFPELWDKPSIGVRKGWKVIWSEHGTSQEALGILGALVGSGALDEMFGGLGGEGSESAPDKSKLN